MSGFEFRPRVKDTDYYLDSFTDLIDHQLGDAHAPLLDHLFDEEEAAKVNGEHATAGLIQRIRQHMIDT